MNKQQTGFTLLEVLIALAILAISLTALLKATSEDIRDTGYLKDKTVAMMLSNNVLTNVQEGRIEAPYTPYNNNFNLSALKQTYYLRVTRLKTADPYVDNIDVTVFLDAKQKNAVYSAHGSAKGQIT